MEYYNKNIQISKNVILDILENIKIQKTAKMLVFGLGYDSNLWYYGNNKNTYFVENNEKYIELNKDIPETNIIKYDYKNINVKNSLLLNDKDINNYLLPQKLLDLLPFDIILIDGPEGYMSSKPGRLLPCFWSYKYLSKKDTLIYIDDSNRILESYCINKYFKDKIVNIFPERNKCCKIIL